ncbi:PHD finger protein ALFIN-LIKE 3, partial [Brachypodium distachyon]|uniref:PHD finger protein ALFIN-LIKE 3 n=1 Tax=Brachypodium distachyon TaxID=15368 RepID=UPI000D0D9EC7
RRSPSLEIDGAARQRSACFWNWKPQPQPRRRCDEHCVPGFSTTVCADQDEFFRQCDPDKKALSLYGHESGEWEVMLPTEMLPAELPEPALGINYARDSMNRLHWLSKVAIHADSWLIAVAFYFEQVFLDKRQRMCLFSMMNDLPTVLESCSYFHKYECTCCAPRKMPPSPVLMVSSGDPKKRSRTTLDEDLNINPRNGSRATEAAEDNAEENKDTDQDYWAACGAPYNKNAFWICCDFCHLWFHGKCVNMTSAQAEQVREYKCPDCILEELGE